MMSGTARPPIPRTASAAPTATMRLLPMLWQHCSSQRVDLTSGWAPGLHALPLPPGPPV